MFAEAKMLKKQELFECANNLSWIEKYICQKNIRLKVFQDAACAAELYYYGLSSDSPILRVADIGGDQSRVIPLIMSQDQRWSGTIIDTWETSVGGGTTKAPMIQEGVDIVDVLLGTERAKHLIKDDLYNAVVSISVVEHVPVNNLKNFFSDCFRICKPGGIILHYVDVHISNDPSHVLGDSYIEAFNFAHGGISLSMAGWGFSTDYISNPDNIMYLWGKLKNNINYRASHQVVTLVLKAVKV